MADSTGAPGMRPVRPLAGRRRVDRRSVVGPQRCRAPTGGLRRASARARARVCGTGKRSGPRQLDHNAEPTRLLAAPGGTRLLAFTQWPICTTETDEKIELVDDCPAQDLEYGYGLDLVAATEIYATADVPGFMNAIALAPDGETAVAYLDYEGGDDLPVDGVVDLSEVVFLDLEDGSAHSLSIGFSPNNIMFSQDGDKDVVISRSKATDRTGDSNAGHVRPHARCRRGRRSGRRAAARWPLCDHQRAGSRISSRSTSTPARRHQRLIAAPSAMWAARAPTTTTRFSATRPRRGSTCTTTSASTITRSRSRSRSIDSSAPTAVVAYNVARPRTTSTDSISRR